MGCNDKNFVALNFHLKPLRPTLGPGMVDVDRRISLGFCISLVSLVGIFKASPCRYAKDYERAGWGPQDI